MIATMRRMGLATLLAAFVAGSALAAMAAGLDNAGPAEAAGSNGYSGSTRSPSGLNTESLHGGGYIGVPPVVYGGPYGRPYDDASCDSPPPAVVYGGILGFECRLQ
jgi:hypothetical protein